MKGHGKFYKGYQLAFEINITPIERTMHTFYNFTNWMAPTLKLIFKTYFKTFVCFVLVFSQHFLKDFHLRIFEHVLRLLYLVCLNIY